MTEEVIGYRVGKLETAIETIAESLQTLTRLEIHHSETRESLERAFKAIEENRKAYELSCDKVDQRLRGVELQMPILKMTSRWIIGGTISIVSGVFATFGLILYALLPVISKTLTP